MAERRTYTKRRKAEAVGLSVMVGTNAASRAMDIPESTLRYWRDDEAFAKLRIEKQEDVAADVWAGFQTGVRRIVELLPTTDDMSKVAIATGILFDKFALMTGQATSRHETVSEGWDDHEKVALREAIRTAIGDRVT